MLAALILAYGVSMGALALRRHWNLESQALDMGYADQVTWNMTQGRLYRFTPFRGLVGSELGRALEYGPGADRDSLFAYHVELLYLPLALLYLIRPGPETLIVFLSVTLASGAIPAYLLARRALRSRVAGLALAGAYLLTPSVQAANLSDFHLVSTAPAFLLWTVYFLATRRYRLFVVGAALSAMLKEEVGLIVAALGGYLLFTATTRGARLVGMAAALGAAAWVALCFLAIMPHFTGGAPSLFAARYGDAIRQLRALPDAWMAGRPAWPVPGYTLTYVREMLAATGFLALAAPAELAVAAPALAINGLSGSTWQHNGGAHYSAEAVPGLLYAAVVGIRRLGGWVARRAGVAPERTIVALSVVALGGALWQTRVHGVLPPAQRFAPAWLVPNGRLETLRPLLERIPRDARVSAQSNVYPHLSNREWVYVFPYLEDSRYVLVDVAGMSDPLYVDDLFPEVTALLSDASLTLLEAVDGFLLFERLPRVPGGARPPAGTGPPGAAGLQSALAPLPERFYGFTRPAPGEPERAAAVQADFEGVFELRGYEVVPVQEVNFGIRRSTITLHVRALRPSERPLRVTTYRLGADSVARIHDDGNPTQRWRPSTGWRAGEDLKLTYPPITSLAGERLGVGAQVEMAGAAGAPGDVPRLRVTSRSHPVADGGMVVVLGRLP